MIPDLLTLDTLVISQTKSFIADEFSISDEHGSPVGTVVQSTDLKDFFMGSRGLTVAATDADGTSTAPVLIIQDLPNFVFDTYEVYLPQEEEPLAIISQKWSFLKTRLSLTMAGFPDVEITGNFWDLDFAIASEGQPLARVTTGWTGLSNYMLGKNTYLLTIRPGLDSRQHAALLGATMSLDMLRAKKQDD
ncbi:LURP-one-related/scramblase family protein [Corynebacterium lubricantis]|uniref:LURP-one-related/scramblase family protein n=1 Tax=Corynebacterium lubricantis TaxID=541095 RepID=UPI00038050F2|nr:phospholipid scramblase-related protein [Corynebacterium lubricantis]